MQSSDPPPRWLTGTLILGAIAAAWAIERPGKSRAPAGSPDGFARPQPPPAAAAAAVGPWRRPWPWWRRVLVSTCTEIGRDRLLAVAAGVVFYALLAIFPAVTAFVSFYGLFASPKTVGEHLYLLSYVLPPGAVGIVQDQIARIAADNDGRLSVAFVAGLAVALWSANAGVKAMIDALNVIEGREEDRGLVALNAVSLGLTFGAIAFLLLAIGAVVAFPLAMSAFGLGEAVGWTAWLARWPAILLVALLGLSVLYRFGPSRTQARRRLLSPGAVLAALAWLGGSAGLSFYLSNFADYNATYGSLGAAIGLMMWMWLSAIAVLAGAELDSEVEKAATPGVAPP